MITRKEIDNNEKTINCPFCKKESIRIFDDEEPLINECEHLLYVTTDLSIMYMSERFKLFLKKKHNLKEIDDSEPLDLDLVTLDDVIQLDQYDPAPSFFGSYFGYAK